MWRILFQNFWVKLVAIVMALLLWFHVATDKKSEHIQTFPLEIVNIPERLVLAQKLPDQVSVTIQGKGKELLKLLLAEKKSVKIDVQEFKMGETDYEVKPEQIPIPEGLELKVTNILPPRSLKVILDYPIDKRVRVRPDVKIFPADGFELVGEVLYNPKEVTLSGPRIWVRGVSVIYTEKVVIGDANEAISDLVDLVLPEGYNLSLSATKINFSQNVEKNLERSISGLPVKSINLPRRAKVMLQPDSIRVTISGAESLVKEITPDQIEVTVDCAKVRRKETVKLPVLISLPQEINLKRAEPDSVEVLIE